MNRFIAATAGLMLGVLAVPGGSGLTAAQTAAPAAAPQQYTVEIVVFRTRQPLGVAEDWTVQGGDPTDVDAAGSENPAPAAPASARTAVQSVSSAQFKLAGTDAALRRSSNYQVLAHVAWTQAATAYNASSGTPLADLGIADSTLKGTVALEQGRYLHLNLDLSWTPPDPPASLLGARSSSAPVTFTLKQKRRMRSFEQHYFDHPAFGVIAIVYPAN